MGVGESGRLLTAQSGLSVQTVGKKKLKVDKEMYKKMFLCTEPSDIK